MHSGFGIAPLAQRDAAFRPLEGQEAIQGPMVCAEAVAYGWIVGERFPSVNGAAVLRASESRLPSIARSGSTISPRPQQRPQTSSSLHKGINAQAAEQPIEPGRAP